MKRHAIFITIFIYLFSLPAIYWGVDYYIKDKDKKLKIDFTNKIESIFNDSNNIYVDIRYSGCPIEYKRIKIPEKPESYIYKTSDPSLRGVYQNELENWKNKYGNLTKLYKTSTETTLYGNNYTGYGTGYKNGWALVLLAKDYNTQYGPGIYEQTIFPYAVGYIRQSDPWFYSYAPSIEDAINNALDFCINNEKSFYHKYFDKGCYSAVFSKIYSADNEYYTLLIDKEPRFSNSGEYYPGRSSLDAHGNPIIKEYIKNDYNQVFIAATQPTTYSIQRLDWAVKENREDLWLHWGISITALFLLIFIPICVITYKHRKREKETLYEKLKRMCNPINFAKKYDKDMIDKANAIYLKLTETSPDDNEALNELQKRATEDLSINLIDKDKLSELKKKVNPQRFMVPYNAEKVSLANDLYSRLSKEGLTYSEFVDIEEQSKQL